MNDIKIISLQGYLLLALRAYLSEFVKQTTMVSVRSVKLHRTGQPDG